MGSGHGESLDCVNNVFDDGGGHGESLDCVNNVFDDTTYTGLPPGPFYTSPKVLKERERFLQLLRDLGRLPPNFPAPPSPRAE